MSVRQQLSALIALSCLSAGPALPGQGTGRLPNGQALTRLVVSYLQEEDETRRKELREGWDKELAPLSASEAGSLRKTLLNLARRVGPRIDMSGTNYFLDPEEKRGKYIARGGGSPLFVGLHGGGQGAGSAESAAGGMGGGGWSWIFPEVLEKTEYGWTDAGTEEFVMALIDAAKRTGKIDPDRIYITGHSMGGYGAWTIGAHHADVFAGTAAYAGAPSPVFANAASREVQAIAPGVLPNLFNLRHFFFQSLDDRNVPPEVNVFANKALAQLRAEHPDGFDYRYVQVDDRGHAGPKEGYRPSQKWVAEKRRDPRPRKILWNPVLTWKRQFYWIWWQAPEHNAILEALADPATNSIDVRVLQGHDPQGLSLLLGPPLVDPEREVVIRVDGKERFRGQVARTFSTLMLTLPRFDDGLLFDARVDL